jgi:hypothetical protein
MKIYELRNGEPELSGDSLLGAEAYARRRRWVVWLVTSYAPMGTPDYGWQWVPDTH